MSLRHTLSCLLLFAAAPAFAQEDGLRPLDPDGVKDLGGWLGEDEVGGGAPADADSDPLAGPSTPAPRASRATEPEMTPEEKRRRSRQIDRNYEKAQEIYQGIINGDKSGNLDRRIANNERIIKEFTARIRSAYKERRELQVSVFNRSFYLKQQVDRGQLQEDDYQQMIGQEERKYESRVKELKRLVGDWKQEIHTAKERLEKLKAQRRILEARKPRVRRRSGKAAARGPQARPGERLLSSLRTRLRKLDHFNTKHTLNGVHPRDLGGGGGPPVVPDEFADMERDDEFDLEDGSFDD